MHIQQSDFHELLVRGLAHKMNNILSLFHGYLGLLLEDKKLDASTMRGLAQIRQGACEASELMDRTRAFAKPSSTIWRGIDLGEFLRTLMPTLETYAERGVKLSVRCDENLPLWVDTSRLRTAIVEVVRNACEASPKGGTVELEARLEMQRSTKNRASAHKEKHGRVGGASNAQQPIAWVALNISNSGEAIAPELAKKIFQPFFTTKPKAFGLGLCVALGFVQQIGGVIRFQSKEGRTTFRLLLPARGEHL